MTWTLFSQIAGTLLVAVVGGWLGHSLSALRDRENDRRKQRLDYLLEAYRRLESASNRDPMGPHWAKIESAVADIQLLGSAVQAELARTFAQSMARDGTAPLDPLIQELRQSLRKEMGLEAVAANVVFLRVHEGSGRGS